MRPLTKKLVRDLWRLRGQVATIGLVLTAGVASWVSLRATYASLVEARRSTYERQSFGHVFADCERAPRSIATSLERISGVLRAEVSVRAPVRIRVEGAASPPVGLVVSRPREGPTTDVPRLMSGRWPEAGVPTEAVLLDAFARAHALALGSRLEIVAAGRTRALVVVGTAISPDMLFAAAPGDMTADARRFGVVWMDEDVVRAMTGTTGTFNRASLVLMPQASEERVVAEVDRLLASSGGRGAYGRREVPSDRMLEQELGQLRGMAVVTPILFLGVAAFLLHAVLGRLVMLERPEIAALRALGFRGGEIAAHYVALVVVITTAGALFGVALGVWLGIEMVELYAPYFHFPEPPFEAKPELVATAVVVSIAAGLAGAVRAALGVARLPPAEAMQPPSPAPYSPGWLERAGAFALLSPRARRMARELSRRPGPTILGALGLSAALAINVIGRFSGDVIEEFVSIQFSRAMREDRAVTLRRDVSKAALDSVRSIDGVRHAEAQRVAPVELVNGHRARRRVLVGHSDDSRLRRRVDRSGAPIAMPASGLSIDDGTAEALGVRAGDSLVVRPLEGGAPPRIERVGAVFAGITALEAHAPARLVDRILGNERINVLLLEVDPERGASVARVLDDAPEVLAVAERTTMIEQFRRLTGETMSTMTAVLTVFATIIAVGVVYNDARILLSSAAHDLATLRVLGFTRAEVRRMLLGQLAIEVALALVPGLVLGTLGAKLVMSTVDPEVHRFPTIVSVETYLVSALVVVGAALGSALVVGRRIDRLDLVRVLKTKE